MVREEHVDLADGLDARITYHVVGDGPPVVLLHGWGASWYLWQETMLALAAAGYRAYAPDHIGCGQSSKPWLLYTPRDYVRHVEAFVAALGLDEFILVGHSLGGHIALSYTLRNPRHVARLVLVGAAFSPLRQITPTRAEALLMLAGLPLLGELSLVLLPARLMRWCFSQPWGGFYQPDHLPPQFLDQMAADYTRAMPLVCNSIRYLVLCSMPGLRRIWRDADLLPYLGRVTAPALVVWGEHDALLRPSSFALLASRLAHGAARPIAQAGHTPPMEAPQEWQRALLEFLH
jgi:pimeloyl-ACP methyl ester carboxylesterase